MPSTMVRKRSGAVDSLHEHLERLRACASGSDASMRFSVSLTAGSSDDGSTAVLMTNATGTPELLFCAHAT